MHRLCFAVVTLAVLVLAGCQRLNRETTFTFTATIPYCEAAFDGPRDDQQLTVTATSTKEKINVYVILEGDREAVVNDLLNKTKPRKLLAGEENSRDISFETTVPAKKDFVVFVNTAKGAGSNTEVKLHVKGR